MTLTVEVIREGAFNLLSDMESLDLIRIKTVPKDRKLSEQFAGALKLSDTEYEAYQNAVKEGRNEKFNAFERSSKMTEAEEMELINRNAERLNREAQSFFNFL